MSYEKPKRIYLKDHNIFIALATKEVMDEIDKELGKIGLCITGIQYYENKYCPERDIGCTCPHWFCIKIENLHTRIYEPNIWFWVCKRKRVYEIRWGHLDEERMFVGKNFWIENERDRTQVEGKYIHSYGLKQVAQDIKIAHQAAEIEHYRGKEYKEYYITIFKKNKRKEKDE